MNRAEYLQQRSDMNLISTLLRELKLDDFLARNTQARLAGPVQDPKFWVEGTQDASFAKLQEDYTLATSLRDLRNKIATP